MFVIGRSHDTTGTTEQRNGTVDPEKTLQATNSALTLPVTQPEHLWSNSLAVGLKWANQQSSIRNKPKTTTWIRLPFPNQSNPVSHANTFRPVRCPSSNPTQPAIEPITRQRSVEHHSEGIHGCGPSGLARKNLASTSSYHACSSEVIRCTSSGC